MTLTKRILACVVALSITFGGGFWLGYETPRPGVDPHDYIETVFTPYESGLASYLSFLDKAESSVHIAAYGFTEPQVVDKLIALKEKGRTVRVLLDRSQSAGKYQVEQVDRLKAAGIEVVVGTSEKSGQIMHHKFTIIDGIWVEDGSWNYTRSADKQANLLNFIRSESRARQFQKIWDRMHAHMVKQKQ